MKKKLPLIGIISIYLLALAAGSLAEIFGQKEVLENAGLEQPLAVQVAVGFVQALRHERE